MLLDNTTPMMTTEHNLKQLIDLYPEPALVICADGIRVYNTAAAQLVGENLYDMDILSLISGDKDRQDAQLRIQLIIQYKIRSAIHYYTIELPSGESFDAEVVSGYFPNDGDPAVFAVIRDVSAKKSDMNEAARLQKKLMNKQKPHMPSLNFDVIYEPSKTISGDFYFHHQLDDHTLIGILGDVSGKGIPAAMNISAFEVMFRTTVSHATHPHEIILQLNKMAFDYFRDRYIAVMCYAFDMNSGVLRVASAGIGEFIVSSKDCQYMKHKLRGPFLGMFEDLPFDYTEIDINAGDRFYFYTDGMEFVLEDDTFHQELMHNNNLDLIRQLLREKIALVEMQQDRLYDDCTIISFEMKR